jgi:hypothetical protein
MLYERAHTVADAFEKICSLILEKFTVPFGIWLSGFISKLYIEKLRVGMVV